MDGSFGAVLDATASGSSSFQLYVAELARQGGLAALAVSAALLFLMLLVEVFKPAESDAATPRLPTLAQPASAVPQPQPVPARVGARAARAESADPLRGSGLSPVDVAALTALRQRIQEGAVSEGPTVAQRLAFTRWLAEHGKLR